QRKEEEAAKYEWLARQAPPDAVWVDPYVGELNDLKLGREARRRQVRALAAKDSLEQQAVLLKRMADDYGDWQSTMDLGVALTQLKQYDQAEAILRKAETLAPTSSEPSYFLGLALFLHGEQLQERRQESDAREKFRAAADALRTATERRADYAQAHYKLGQTVEKLDRRTEALEAFRTAVRCRPDMANFQLELGKALAAADQKAEAAAHLHEAQELAPDDPRPREALGRLDKGKQPD
ncbi:MAG TPA: tetratricopeptide repeat protein, partial [Gemmataceae bacterium]|nr:tetratricopeptide repeat protein [Gemmataceae bacterium]